VQWLFRIFSEKRGVVQAEVMVIMLIIVLTSAAVAAILTPEVSGLYDRATQNVIDVMGSGY